MGFDCIVIAPLLPSHCGFSFVFGYGVSFLVSSSVFLSMIVQQLVVIPVFLQEGVRAHPSTLPSWTNLPKFFIITLSISLLGNCKNFPLLNAGVIISAIVYECGFLLCLLEMDEISPKYWLTLGWNFPPGPLTLRSYPRLWQESLTATRLIFGRIPSFLVYPSLHKSRTRYSIVSGSCYWRPEILQSNTLPSLPASSSFSCEASLSLCPTPAQKPVTHPGFFHPP